MKSKSILVAASIVLAGCSVGLDKPNLSVAQDVVEKLRYIKDPKTDLCFAIVSTSQALHPSDNGMTMTWVPCEPKVLQ